MNDTIQGAVEPAVTDRYEALLRVSQTLMSIHSSEELFRVLARELRGVVSFYVMGLGIYDENMHEVRLTSYGEPGVPLQVPKLAPEETFTWWVYQHQQPLMIPSLDTETRFPAVAEMLKNRGVRSVCALPLTTVHRRLGGLAVGSTEADAYSREEVSFLSLVANQVALAVDDALNFDALQLAEENVRASEKSFRLIVDSIPGLVVTMTAQGELEFVSQQCLDYFGMTLDELKGWATSDIVHSDDLSRVLATWKSSVETGHPYDSEYRIRRADGMYRWFHVCGLPLRNEEGRIVRWYVLHTDIDDRKRVEDALRASELNLRLIVDVIPQFISVIDPEGRVLYANQLLLEYIGWNLEDLKANDFPAMIFHPDDFERLRGERQKALALGIPFELELRSRRNDGKYRWFLVRYNPLRDERKNVLRWYASATDIDDRKRAEEALRASELNFRGIIDSIPGLIHTLTGSGELEFVNQQNLEYFGKTLEELRSWASNDVFHPDDLPRALDAWKHTLETGRPDEIECRLRRADGVHRWFQLRCLPLRDSEGRIIRWMSLHTDIDDRKRAEEALRTSELNFRLIVDSVPGLVCTMNAAGELQLLNRPVLEYFGKTIEELKSWATSDAVHPDDLPRVITAFASSIETGNPYDIEHRCRRADGVYRWFQVRALPVRETEGRIISWYILLTDIDDRKKAEDRLQLLLDVTNQVVSNLQLRDLLRAISGNIRRVMQCDCASLALPDAENNQLQLNVLDFPEGKGFIKEEGGYSIEGSPYGTAFRTMKPLALDSPFTAWVDNAVVQSRIVEGFKSLCFIPLIRRNRAIGTLNLGRLRGGAFTEEDLYFLGQVASQIAIAVENALEYGQITEAKERLAEQKVYLENEIRLEHNFEEIIGNSPRLKAVLESVRIVAPADSTVLIQGETGTGKEVIARAIHNLSSRKDQAFVKVNCAAIPLGLLESELFGHEKGSFTGAIARRIGRFELAHKGTLFLDEVSDIPLELQPKLLRVLQEQEFERLGSSRTQHVDVRLLAATNVSLSQMVAEKKFRSDLYYRLKVFPIDVPPLRDRRGDIPLLVHYFANKYARRMGKQIESIPNETMDALSHYSWPGNIRELQNLMERSALLSTGPSLRVPLAEILADSGLSTASGDNALKQAEREQIVRALRDSNWVVGGAGGAAARLGLKRTSLAYKMQKLGISRPPQ